MNQKNKCRIFRLFSFILPVLILCFYFYRKQITPFGDLTFLIHDMRAQYIDFFAYMRSVLSGVNDFNYSFSRGLGGDFKSFFAYYLTSPFNLITILFPDDVMPIGVTFEMLLLFGLAGISCYYSLEKLTENSSRYLLLFYSTAYALSGWMLINAENFQFIPEAAILPMVVISCQKYKKTGKIWWAVFWLAISVILNFYLGYMVFIFAFLWLIIPDGDRINVKLLLIFIIAAIISAPVWVPVLRQLSSTIKNQETTWYEPVFNFSVIPFLKKFLPGQFDHRQYMDNGLPAVYCSLVSIIAAIAYFILPGNKKTKYHRAALLIILLISMFFSPLTMIWQGFSKPHWWPYRFSFLLIFLIVLCGASCKNKYLLILAPLGIAGIIFNLFVTFDVKLENNEPLSVYSDAIHSKRSLLESLPDTDELYRIDDLSPRNDNDAMHFSYSGITNFDSLANKAVFQFLDSMGFPQNRYTVQYGLGNTEFANSLLGVRYVLGNGNINSRNLPSSFAYLIPKNSEFDILNISDPAAFQNALAEALGSKSDILEKIEISELTNENIECDDLFCWKTDAILDSFFKYKISIPEGKKIFSHVDESFLVGDLFFVIDDQEIPFKSPDGLIPIPVVGKNNSETITIRVDSSISDKPLVSFYTENTDNVSDLFTPLMKDVYVKKISSSVLEISIPQSTGQETLLVTVPYDSRWKATSGNDILNTGKIWGTFLGVELPSGVKMVRLEYH